MDTRKKIIKPDEAAGVARRILEGGKALRLVSGYFDPLLAEHSRRLAAIRRHGASLIAVIATPARPVLGAQARAELVAALEVVDYAVIPENSDVEELLGNIPASEVIRLEETDEDTTREWINHVRNRQGAN